MNTILGNLAFQQNPFLVLFVLFECAFLKFCHNLGFTDSLWTSAFTSPNVWPSLFQLQIPKLSSNEKILGKLRKILVHK